MSNKGFRPRRIAADEAHSWARNLRLRNAGCKLVLSMLALYVDGDGVCFVSSPQLADDCELNVETVRHRLAWLEKMGAIARRPQWIDQNGCRNGEGRGRRTSDEITLLISADLDEIEARAKGASHGGSARSTSVAPHSARGANDTVNDSVDPHSGRGADPRSVEGDSDEVESVAPRAGSLPTPALESGAESSEPEPEPETFPPPPLRGGGHEDDSDFDKDIAEAARNYPAPIANMPSFRAIMATLDATIRKRVIAAMSNYAAFIETCDHKRKPRGVKDAHRWVASGMWEGYATEAAAAPLEKPGVSFGMQKGPPTG